MLPVQPRLPSLDAACVRLDVEYHVDGTISVEAQFADDRRFLARAQAERYEGLTASESLDVICALLTSHELF